MSALLGVARRLATANPKKPSQAFLRRAVSTTYYALFDHLAREGADTLVGTAADQGRAWAQAYRALEHGAAKDGCKRAPGLGFPAGVLAFATAFTRLQEQRHAADYDPLAKFSRVPVLELIQETDRAIASLRAAPKADGRAFAVPVLLRRR